MNNKAYQFLNLLLIFQIIDVVTTYYLLNIGFIETNFIVVFLMERFNDIIGLSILKIFAIIILFIYVPSAWSKIWVRIVMYTANILYFIVCLLNISLILVELMK